MYTIYLKSLFLYRHEEDGQNYITTRNVGFIDLLEKGNKKEIKMTNLLRNLVRNGFLNFRALQERLFNR
jgi:hypothetical protein